MAKWRTGGPGELAAMALVACLVLSISTQALAARPAEAAKRAGSFWLGLSREQKTDLVLGIFDGFNLNENILSITLKNEYTICSDIMESIMRQSDAFFAGMPAGQIVTALDAFYTNKRNRNIPVSWGIWVVVRENRKDPTVGEFLNELRAAYP
ncbi:MAG: hypothetical protein AAGU21_14360 [Solidesulfovibrio sp.]|uniref:hypothetical protein n=2 Tax=Solidesulfovibrio sp. TaxID=2910990 RepID=UPI0031586381